MPSSDRRASAIILRYSFLHFRSGTAQLRASLFLGMLRYPLDGGVDPLLVGRVRAVRYTYPKVTQITKWGSKNGIKTSYHHPSTLSVPRTCAPSSALHILPRASVTPHFFSAFVKKEISLFLVRCTQLYLGILGVPRRCAPVEAHTLDMTT
jgi:hypothetical protein